MNDQTNNAASEDARESAWTDYVTSGQIDVCLNRDSRESFDNGFKAGHDHAAAELRKSLCNEHHEHQQCDLCDQQDMTLAAIIEKADALVARLITLTEFYEGVYASQFESELTALKAELDKYKATEGTNG